MATTTDQSDRLPTSPGPSFASGRLGHRRSQRNRLRTWARTHTWKPPDQSSLHDICKTGTKTRHGPCKPLFLQKDISPARHHLPRGRIGGAERDRTADPLLAKQVLSQLSYSPNHRNTRQNKPPGSGKPGSSSTKQMVGPGRLELPTPRLSSVCSNQLSYGPISLNLKACNQAPIQDDSPSPVVRRPRGAPRMPRTCGTARERSQKVLSFLKKEKRGRRVPPYRHRPRSMRRIAFRWSPDWRHLCSKKHGKVHLSRAKRLTNSTASLERR